MTDNKVPPAPASGQGDTLAELKEAQVWLFWKEVLRPGYAKPSKIPHYINGQPRSGQLDTDEDRARLVTYQQAVQAWESCGGAYTGFGFALGPDNNGISWQGVDLDKIDEHGLRDVANMWVNTGQGAGWGYMERSPSGTGAHIIGCGKHFGSLGPNSSGIEAYAGGRFFTFTGEEILESGERKLIDLAGFVEKELVPRHRAEPSQSHSSGQALAIDDWTKGELRTALAALPSDERHLWVRMGMALKELGGVGYALWTEWSQKSAKYDARDAEKNWASFKPTTTGYQSVFAEAQNRGWLNPLSKAAAPAASQTEPYLTLEFATMNDTATLKLEYLIDPMLPQRCVVGFFGRGSTAKSSYLATTAAWVSDRASTLWVSVEEPDDWIKVRHIKCGGRDNTLAVVKAMASRRDKDGHVIASSFNCLTDLEPAIVQAKAAFAQMQKPPLGLVVLDTVVGLTHWAKGETPNDDASVKRLMAHLQAWAEQHDLTIAVIGHANKGKHDNLADNVMGAAAWTNSPRLSFMHGADQREEHSFVMRTAKTNFEPFGMAYTTQPVHVLYQRENGPDTVLVKVNPGATVWGALDSMEMFRDAVKVPKDDDDGAGSTLPRQTLADQAVAAVEELVGQGVPGELFSREDVERHLGREIDRKRWTQIDDRLFAHPLVEVASGEHNRKLYRARQAG